MLAGSSLFFSVVIVRGHFVSVLVRGLMRFCKCAAKSVGYPVILILQRVGILSVVFC